MQSDIFEILFNSAIFYIILFWGCQSWKAWSHPIKKRLIRVYNLDKEVNATWLKSIFKWIYVEFAVWTFGFEGIHPKSTIHLTSVFHKKYSNDFPTHSSKMSANINLAFGKFLRHLLIYFDSRTHSPLVITEWRYQNFDRNRYRDFFYDNKFSETEIFFRD